MFVRYSLFKSSFFLPKRNFRAAVVLSGCGVQDGSEITETVSLLISLSRHSTSVMHYAPNRLMTEVVNHVNGTLHSSKRNIMEESARIVRGVIKDVNDLNVNHYDALFLPGGFGCAKNLSDFANKGSDMEVDPEIERVFKDSSHFWNGCIRMDIFSSKRFKFCF